MECGGIGFRHYINIVKRDKQSLYGYRNIVIFVLYVKNG